MTYTFAPPTTANASYYVWTGADNVTADTFSVTAGATKALQKPPAEHASDGVMLALYPSPKDAAELAMDGGTAAADLHVTVAYLGSRADVDARALLAAAESAVAGVEAIGGVLAGHARFTGGDRDVLVALYDSPALEMLRRAVDDALTAHDLDRDRKHGYTPHLTLGYLDAGDPAPLARLAPRPLSFTALSVVHGTDRTDIPLGRGRVPALATKTAGAAARHADLGDFVWIDGRIGLVDLIVAGGQLPAALSADGEPVTGTKTHPAARIVEYTPRGDGSYAPTGTKYAYRAGDLIPIGPLRTKTVARPQDMLEAVSWAQAAYADHARRAGVDRDPPPTETLMSVYGRGVLSWPGATLTTLTAEQWAVGRVDAFTAAWYGARPAGYHGDDDLLDRSTR